MKRRILVLMVAFAILLQGCGGVSQEEYEKAIAERDEYKEELDSLEQGTSLNVTKKTESNNEQESEKLKIKLLKSGWICTKSNDNVCVYYAVEIENPNVDYAVKFPRVTVTVKDDNGKILKNQEQVLDSIAAGDTIIYGNEVFYEGNKAESVEISVSNNDDDFVIQDDTRYIKTSEFTFSNTNENDGIFKTYTGEITNNSDVDFDMVAVSVIYKKENEMLGGETTYIDSLKAGETKVFELSASSDIKGYDSYEFHAIQW